MRLLDSARPHAAHLQVGLSRTALEAAMKPHGLRLRHDPQACEFSTPGWLASPAASVAAVQWSVRRLFRRTRRLIVQFA